MSKTSWPTEFNEAEEAEKLRDGMARADANAQEEWKVRYLAAIKRVARLLPTFTTRDVDDYYRSFPDRPWTHESRASGPRMLIAKSRGWCRQANPSTPMRKTGSSGRKQQVWVSLIYVCPECNGMEVVGDPDCSHGIHVGAACLVPCPGCKNYREERFISELFITRDMLQAAAVALVDFLEPGLEELPSNKMQELCRILANKYDEDAEWILVPTKRRMEEVEDEG